jgi:hypothetical protein
MKVYVVLVEDRGFGVSVAGVFASLAAAEEYLAGPDGSNCYLASDSGEEVQRRFYSEDKFVESDSAEVRQLIMMGR